jgi:hypothetical protein
MNKSNYSNIFIVGCPRSGKTLLQNILGFHEKLAWFSQYNGKFKNVHVLSVLNRIYGIPRIGDFLLSFSHLRIFPHPEEISKKYVSTTKKNGSLDERHVTIEDKLRLSNIFKKQLVYQGKDIIITDCGRPARLLYFDAIFPRSKFIHVIRDGRSVVAEFLLTRPHWFSLDKNLSDFYPMAPKELKILSDSYKGKEEYQMVLAALRWKMAIKEIERQSKTLQKNQFYTVRYEDFTQNPIDEINKILDFLGLKMTPRIEKVIKSRNLRLQSSNQLVFNSRQRNLLEKLLKDELIRYNYK